jgi:hypothetical protein
VKLKPIVETDGSTTEHDLETRFRTVVHGAVGALPSKLRRQVESQFKSGKLENLTEAMAAWIYGSKMDDASFAHNFFGRHADAQEVGSLRAAVSETVEAETRSQLAAASEHLPPGTPFVTRPAPAVGANPGGGIEVVVPRGSVKLKYFSAQ